MKCDVSVRALEPGDLPEVAALYEQPRAVWGTLQSPFTSIETRRKNLESLPAADKILVAFVEGKLVGNAGLHSLANRRRMHAASIGLAVHDAYTRKGVGNALLAAMLDLADRWLSYKRLELTVWADNAPAIALYEKAGFEHEGLFRNYAWRDGAYVDALAMARLKF